MSFFFYLIFFYIFTFCCDWCAFICIKQHATETHRSVFSPQSQSGLLTIIHDLHTAHSLSLSWNQAHVQSYPALSHNSAALCEYSLQNRRLFFSSLRDSYPVRRKRRRGHWKTAPNPWVQLLYFKLIWAILSSTLFNSDPKYTLNT